MDIIFGGKGEGKTRYLISQAQEWVAEDIRRNRAVIIVAAHGIKRDLERELSLEPKLSPIRIEVFSEGRQHWRGLSTVNTKFYVDDLDACLSLFIMQEVVSATVSNWTPKQLKRVLAEQKVESEK